MALNLNGTTQRALALITPSSSTATYTFVCYWKPTSAPAAVQDVFGLCRSTNNFRREHMIAVRGDQAGDPIASHAYSGSAEQYATGGNVIVGDWNAIVLTKTTTLGSGNTETALIYANSTTGVSHSFTSVSGVCDALSVGAVQNNGPWTNFAEGAVAHIAYYDGAVLNATDIAALINKTATPNTLPSNTTPTYYRRLVGDTTTGVGAATLTLTGSPTVDSVDPLSNTTLTDIDGDEVLFDGQTNATFTGTSLSSVNNILVTSSNTSNNQSWTVSNVTATSGTIDSATRGNLPYTDVNHSLLASVRNGSTILAGLAISLTPPTGYVTYPVTNADANKTVGDSALAGLGTIPANSQVKVPTTVTISGTPYTVQYDLSPSGNWTGLITVVGYVVNTNVSLSGAEYFPGNSVWENLPITLTPKNPAPILSAVSATASDETTISYSVTTDTAGGIMYVYASQSPTASASTVKTNGTQTAVISSGAISGLISVSGGEGTYYLHFVHTASIDSIVYDSSGVNLESSSSNQEIYSSVSNAISEVFTSAFSNSIH